MSAIHVNHLTKQVGSFSLQDLSLSIPVGQITTIVGPNGSGKSTLLKTMARLLSFTNGTITVNEKDIRTYSTNQYARTLAMLPQSKDDLPNLTVFEIVKFGRAPYQRLFSNRLTPYDIDRINEAMDITGVLPFKDRLFQQLSGGEQQRVRIAMALAQDTRILLLDEPTTFLDIAHQFELMDLLKTINRVFQTTIIMVLHDLQQAAAYGQEMIALKQGKIMTIGKPKEVLTETFLQEVFNLDAHIYFKDHFPLIVPKIKKQQEVL